MDWEWVGVEVDLKVVVCDLTYLNRNTPKTAQFKNSNKKSTLNFYFYVI